MKLDQFRSNTDRVYALLARGESINRLEAMLLLGIQNLTATMYEVRKKYRIPRERIARTHITLQEAAVALREEGVVIDPVAYDPRLRVTQFALMPEEPQP